MTAIPRTLLRGFRSIPRATSSARTTAAEGCRSGRRVSPASTPRRSAASPGGWRQSAPSSPRRWSLQRADHGEQPIWMAVALAAMLGQIGLPGGGFGFGYGQQSASAPRAIPSPPAHCRRAKIRSRSSSRWRGSPTCCSTRARPSTTTAQRITYPDIRLVYWCGGNPFHHHQDLNRLLRAWRSPRRSSSMSHGGRRRAPCRHRAAGHHDARAQRYRRRSPDRFMVAMQQAIEPVGEARNDYRHLLRARRAARLRARPSPKGRDEMGWLRHLYDGDARAACRHGHRTAGFRSNSGRRAMSSCPRRAEPGRALRGLPRRPATRKPLPTPSGQIEIFSETIAGFGYDDCPGHPAWIEPAEWLGRRWPRAFRCISSPTSRARGCTASSTRAVVSGAARCGPRAGLAPSRAMRRRAASRRRCRAGLQRSRRGAGRRGRDRPGAPGWCSSRPAHGTTRPAGGDWRA